MGSEVISCGIFGLIGLFVILYLLGFFHIVQEGYIGMYTRGGALLGGYTEPGLHFMIPIITKFHPVQLTLQTDQVINIPCGTASGVLITFDKIEVVNRLKQDYAWQTIKNYSIEYDQTWIFDKIHHEINQFCSKHTLHQVLIEDFDKLDDSLQASLEQGCSQWAPGIEIISIRVTKPNIPKDLAEQFIQGEVEKTQLLIEKERQKVKQEETEIQKQVEQIRAQTQYNISAIQQEKEMLQQKGNQKIQEYENLIQFENERTIADAKRYRIQKEIEINERRLTNNYLKQQALEKIKNTQKVIYTESIPQYISENIDIIEVAKKN